MAPAAVNATISSGCDRTQCQSHIAKSTTYRDNYLKIVEALLDLLVIR